MSLTQQEINDIKTDYSLDDGINIIAYNGYYEVNGTLPPSDSSYNTTTIGYTGLGNGSFTNTVTIEEYENFINSFFNGTMDNTNGDLIADQQTFINTYFTSIDDSNTIYTTINFNESINEYFSLKMTFYFLANETADYRFNTNSDDASYVWIGNEYETIENLESTRTFIIDDSDPTSNRLPIVANGGLHGETDVTSSSIALEKGKLYPVLIYFGEFGGGELMQFSFTTSDTTFTTISNNQNDISTTFVDNGLNYFMYTTEDVNQIYQASLVGNVFGDPHVVPIMNKKNPYLLPHFNKTYLLFDNNSPDNRLIVKAKLFTPNETKLIKGKSSTYLKYFKFEFNDFFFIIDAETLKLKEYDHDKLLNNKLENKENQDQQFENVKIIKNNSLGFNIYGNEFYSGTSLGKEIIFFINNDLIKFNLIADSLGRPNLKSNIQLKLNKLNKRYSGALIRKEIIEVEF